MAGIDPVMPNLERRHFMPSEIGLSSALKSFSKDWARWSSVERLTAKTAMLVALFAIVGPLALSVS